MIFKDYNRNIIGISNAREKARGEKVLYENIKLGMKDKKISKKELENVNVEFIDDYILNGYRKL